MSRENQGFEKNEFWFGGILRFLGEQECGFLIRMRGREEGLGLEASPLPVLLENDRVGSLISDLPT